MEYVVFKKFKNDCLLEIVISGSSENDNSRQVHGFFFSFTYSNLKKQKLLNTAKGDHSYAVRTLHVKKQVLYLVVALRTSHPFKYLGAIFILRKGTRNMVL